MMHNIITVVDENVYLDYINKHKCVVKFTATWCGPCKNIAPLYKELSTKYRNIKFLEIDIDNADIIANYENVKGVPCFYFYNHCIRKDNLTFSGANIKLLTLNIESLNCIINPIYNNSIDNNLINNNLIYNNQIDNNLINNNLIYDNQIDNNLIADI